MDKVLWLLSYIWNEKLIFFISKGRKMLKEITWEEPQTMDMDVSEKRLSELKGKKNVLESTSFR